MSPAWTRKTNYLFENNQYSIATVRMGKPRIRLKLFSWLGRYSLLDELGFEHNALFHQADDGRMTSIKFHEILTSLLFQSALRTSFTSLVRVLRTFSTVACEKIEIKRERKK